MDAYRTRDGVQLWIKTRQGDATMRFPHSFSISVHDSKKARETLERLGLIYTSKKRRTYDDRQVRVLEVPIDDLTKTERIIDRIEKASQYRIPLYDADIAPEQHFLHANDLSPGDHIDEDLQKKDSEVPALKQVFIRVITDNDPRQQPATIKRILLDDETIEGSEEDILRRFVESFKQRDPDIVQAYEAFCYIPLIDRKLREARIKSPLHRLGDEPLKYRGGTTFYSYGLIKFRDYGVRLKGRFLVDTTSVVGGECDAEAIFALCKLSGLRFQHLASRSAGSVFQGALVRRLIQKDILVAHKQKPIPEPVSMTDLVSQDRAGISLDAKIGIHENVAEIDFVSMFPFLMHQKNISPEKIGRGEKAPDVEVMVDQDDKGHIPQSLKRFIDLRMEYKRSPTPLNKRRAKGLKSVLVSANGYLRFREFKLGLSTTHVALCSWVRETFLTAKRLAEEEGYEVVHGLVDSLYIKKQGINRAGVEQLMERITQETGVPIAFEGLFKWIVFPPSVQDRDRPVVTRYYGALRDGTIKVRGVEARQKSQPQLIRRFQTAVIKHLARHDASELPDRTDDVLYAAKELIAALPRIPTSLLTYRLRISKQRYTRDIPQRRILQQLKTQGITPMPGNSIYYVWDAARGAVLPQSMQRADTKRYTDAIARSLYSVLAAFGHTKESIRESLDHYEQRTLYNYGQRQEHSQRLWQELKILCEIV